ncbi:hypothetical protein EXU48_00320 [Occultella glacieicola]|uniref:Uncharacterized protein n=1 Tax=Occultella glacieicola TaxID=2518684 RepID=A0ABY2E863_9MICO|nr:hypothetical protein [Occultella glacieicola]TDE98699.1 hypothetical protein EXU48_00320 [Occultella glacieicola]
MHAHTQPDPQSRAAQNPDLTRAGVSRRAVLLGTAGLTGALALGAASTSRAWATSEGTVLPLVDPLGAPPDRTAFEDSEQVLAGYLTVVAPMANSIRDLDPNYGWMEDGWWRSPEQPYNAREMEQVATLTWFLTHERSWNPYFGDARLRDRLEAALTYYLGIQLPSGAWSEYAYDVPHLAPTGFGSVALSLTHTYLSEAGELPGMLPRIEAALRAAALWLTDRSKPHWARPIPYTNQVVAGLVGVANAAEALADPSIAAAADECWTELLEHSITPAGHSMEPAGYDNGYSFTVALPDIADAAQTGVPQAVEMARSMMGFIGRSAVWEPDRAGWVHWAAICVRNSAFASSVQPSEVVDRSALGRALLGELPEIGAFHPTDVEILAAREAWAADPSPVAALAKKGTSPRTWMHGSRAPLGLTVTEREAAIEALPYHARDRFTEVRRAGSFALDYLFVRRPSYYLTAALGHRDGHDGPYRRLRMGPGLLWHPTMGTLAVVLNNYTDDGWGHFPDASEIAVVEVDPTYYSAPGRGGTELPAAEVDAVTGDFSVAYVDAAIGTDTDLSFHDHAFTQRIRTPEPGRALVPLLVQPGDVLTFSDGTVAGSGDVRDLSGVTGLTLARNGTTFEIGFGGARDVRFAATDRAALGGTRRQHQLWIPHDGALDIAYTFATPAEVATRPPGAAVLSTDSGRSGVTDGTFTVTLNLWWGINATVFRLYENGALVATRSLQPASPGAQTVQVPLTGRVDGDYEYTGRLSNAAGTVPTGSATVRVRDAKPAVPVLSHDNHVGRSDYTVTSDLWWGTNATAYRLYEDGVLVDSQALTAATPAAQQASTAIVGRPAGEYRYHAEFANAAGTSSSDPITVRVR